MIKENKDNVKENYIYHMIRDVKEINGLKLKPEHNCILFAIESRGKKAFPAHETLADDCGMGITKLKKALNELKDHEVLSWMEGKGTSNRYKINRSLLSEIWHTNQLDEIFGQSEAWNKFHPEWDL
jgi:hypothetical protein